MKTITLAIFVFSVLFPSLSFSQSQSENSYNGALYELYFNRQPNAKAEAMGKGLVTNTEADFGSYYNPALTSLGNGIVLNISKTFLPRDETAYGYIGVGYSDSKLGSFSISRYNYGRGITEGRGDKYHNSIHTLNYSREISKGFYAGANVELVHMGYLGSRYSDLQLGSPVFYYGDNFKSSDAFTLDLGILRRVEFGNPQSKASNIFQVGAAIYNVTGSQIENKNYKDLNEVLPVIFRAGISLINNFFTDTKKTSSDFQMFTVIEFESVLNAQDVNTLKFGEQVIIGDFFILRGGVTFRQKEINNDSYYTYTKNRAEFNLGAGLKLPLNKIVKSDVPLNLVVDFTPSLPETKTNKSFTNLSLSFNYTPKF